MKIEDITLRTMVDVTEVHEWLSDYNFEPTVKIYDDKNWFIKIKVTKKIGTKNEN